MCSPFSEYEIEGTYDDIERCKLGRRISLFPIVKDNPKIK